MRVKFHIRAFHTVKFRVPHVRHTPCFTSHFIPSLPHSLVVYIARSVFSRRGCPPMSKRKGSSTFPPVPIAPTPTRGYM